SPSGISVLLIIIWVCFVISSRFPSPSGISVLLILSSAMQHSCGGKCSFAAQKYFSAFLSPAAEEKLSFPAYFLLRRKNRLFSSPKYYTKISDGKKGPPIRHIVL
ncbi:hypothetical protein, partial [Oribacterium sp. oral taxon 078]|uniref:hypothetical protein n=1 Tax=Oribacterium sp. oral taxon 078 TaxID=652706 RepID=UPI001A98FC43